MKRKIALVIAAVMTVSMLGGCGGSKGYDYTAGNGSFSITLPSEDWEITSEDDESGMYIFSLPATSDSAVDTGLDSDAVILYFNLSAETGTLGYDTIPTTEEALVESLGDELEYEVLDFEGDEDENGVKSNYYTIKFVDDTMEGYIASKTVANSEEGYIIAGEVLSSEEDLLEDVKKSIESVEKHETTDTADTDNTDNSDDIDFIDDTADTDETAAE